MDEGQIKIKSLRRNNHSKVNAEEIIGFSERYFSIDINSFLDNSLVQKVDISEKAWVEIIEWIRASLDNQSVPEVGGFLLGQAKEISDGGWHSVVDEFIPAKEVAFQSNVVLEFGEKPLMELDMALSSRPEMINVGWIHTHPGHTPYLSNTDLNFIHEPFYTENYQLAIVVDCLTTNWDTGIFTRKEDASMNNQEAYTDWISWSQINNTPPSDI